MAKSKIAVTLDAGTLIEVDRLVSSRVFPNRSHAIETAVREKLERMNRNRLARECAKLEPAEEKAFAEEGMEQELDQWPEY